MSLTYRGTPVQQVTPTYAGEVANGNSGAAFKIFWSKGAKQTITLTAACTLVFTPMGNIATADRLLLRLVQDATGGRVVTWPATVKWQGAAAPVLSAAAGAEDIMEFYWNGASFYGIAHLKFA